MFLLAYGKHTVAWLLSFKFLDGRGCFSTIVRNNQNQCNLLFRKWQIVKLSNSLKVKHSNVGQLDNFIVSNTMNRCYEHFNMLFESFSFSLIGGLNASTNNLGGAINWRFDDPTNTVQLLTSYCGTKKFILFLVLWIKANYSFLVITSLECKFKIYAFPITTGWYNCQIFDIVINGSFI